MVKIVFYIALLVALGAQASTTNLDDKQDLKVHQFTPIEGLQSQREVSSERRKRDSSHLAASPEKIKIPQPAEISPMLTAGVVSEYPEDYYLWDNEIIDNFNASSSGLVKSMEMNRIRGPAAMDSNLTRVNLCCEENELHDPSTMMCYESSEKNVPVFQNMEGDVLSEVPYEVVPGFPNCTFYALSADTDIPDDQFILTTDGELVVGYSSQAISPHFTIARGRYCLLFPEPQVMEALVCFPDEIKTEATKNRNQFQQKVYPVCLLVSSVFLLLTLLVYCLLKELREDLLGKSFMISIAMLGLAQVLLVVGNWGSNSFGYRTCFVVASLIHFSFLSTFLWLNVISYLVFRSFWCSSSSSVATRGRVSPLLWQCLYAFGLAFLLSALAVMDDLMPTFNTLWSPPGFVNISCWFANTDSLIVYMLGPCCLILVANLIFFCLAAYKMRSIQKQTQRSTSHFTQYLKLFVLMGVSWIFEIISTVFKIVDENSPIHYLWVFMDLVNILQGVLIFVLFVCRKCVLRHLSRKLCITSSVPGDGDDAETAPCNTIV